MTDHMTLGDGVGRAALRGAGLGFLAMAVIAIGVTSLAGLELNDAVGVGTFAALWSGPGFGATFGAIRVITRNEKLAAAAKIEARAARKATPAPALPALAGTEA